MVKQSNPSDVDASNIVRLTIDELSAEDRQAYEALIKECEEESIRHKEKEIEEKHQWFLSHFSKNRKCDVSKDKEVVILLDEGEKGKANSNVSTSASSVTLEQVRQLLVIDQKKMLAIVQNISISTKETKGDFFCSSSHLQSFGPPSVLPAISPRRSRLNLAFPVPPPTPHSDPIEYVAYAYCSCALSSNPINAAAHPTACLSIQSNQRHAELDAAAHRWPVTTPLMLPPMPIR